MADNIQDIYEFCESYGDDDPKQISIYTSFINKAILEDSDRESLRKERGFSDEVIDLLQFKSCRRENTKIIDELKEEFSEEDLIDAGLLETSEKGIKACSQLLGVFKNDKFVNNIVIPYFDNNGKIYYIRPHKFGLKGKGINVYCPVRDLSSNPWIITESEFKAAACLQYGYPALGLPGIHSFAANNFDRLTDFIEGIPGIDSLVIIFDNEIKNNKAYKNYKSDVRKQWDTQWRSFQLCDKLYKALPGLRSVRVGTLPDDWMEEGKIDIDGALADGKSKSQFKAVVYSAKTSTQYLQALPSTAKQIISRRIYRDKMKATIPIERDDNRYVVKKKGKAHGDNEPEMHYLPVSNFVMEINKVLVEGDIHIREITFYGQDGSTSNPYIMEPNAIQLRDFRTWIAGCGNFVFEGNQDDLLKIWNLEFALCDSRKIFRPEEIGFLKNSDSSDWLFGNCMIKGKDTILEPDDEGVIWDGLEGYIPRSIRETDSTKSPKSKMPKLNLDPEIEFGLPELREAIRKMEAVCETKAICLAVGWVVGCLLSDVIYKKYACFPLLFISGKRESGKTTLGNWLMSMVGLSEIAGENIGDTSIPGVERNLAWYSSLIYWLDEYRNSTKIKNRWDGFFRNVYQRQSSSKGTLKKTVRAHEVNGCLIVSGEETPEDNALLSRCIMIPLASNRNRKTNEESYRMYNEIEDLRIKGLLSRLALHVLTNKERLTKDILVKIEGWKKQMQEKNVGERIALNYAIPAVCYDAVFLDENDISARKDFAKWVLTESGKSEEEKESQHVLYQFLEGLIPLQEDLENYFTVFTDNGKRQIALHFPTFYKMWAQDERRLGHDQFKKQTVLNYLREEPYFIADNKLKRLNGKATRCLFLSLEDIDSPPQDLKTLADGQDALGIITGSEETPF
jgi:hypothetical protein